MVFDGEPDPISELLRSLEQPPDGCVPGAGECLRLVKLFMDVTDSGDRRIILELVERFAARPCA